MHGSKHGRARPREPTRPIRTESPPHPPKNPTPIFLLLLQETPPAGATPAEGAAPPNLMNQIFGGITVPLLLCFGVFWFLILRPEQKNRKKRAAMLAAVKKGDKVMTSSGLYGTIVQVQDQVVTLQVADGVRMRFALSAIQSLEEEGGGVVEAKTS
jgi:preprotein translocase subunit YajC